jgi:UDP-GlcNAc:undecaprenyl-phosphate GlcNAc-1-phosphate transferase
MFFGIIVPSLSFLDLSRPVRGLLVGAAVATVVGAIDDFRGLRWWEKLSGQVLAGAIPPIFGIWIDHFTFPFLGVYDLSVWLGVPLTVVWIVAVMNMVNFLDGLDGLAAGVCGIAAGTFALIELDLGNVNAAILLSIVLGATIGFLRHNFYPARIFMGDSGALLLGFTLAGVSVEGLLKTASLVTLFLPLAVLAVPIIDTSFVVAKRIKHGLPVYEGDRFHLHHRFLSIGYSQRRAVLTIYAWCATLAAAALATRFVKPHPHGDWRPWALAVDAAIGLIALAASVYIVYLLEIVKLANPIIRRREALAQERKTA